MNHSSFLKMNKKIVVYLVGISVFVIHSVATVNAEVQTDKTITDFASSPINLSGGAVSPHVMINTSNDHQFYFKVYNDYTDLDGDGIVETTYKHSVDYYGYFDNYTCYDYKQATFDVNGSGGVNSDDTIFIPVSYTPQKDGGDKYCTGGNSGYWSGNFLNWITMTRIDAIRKILFGGWRRLDSPTNTVLERSYLPHDAHSWAKHYEGADLDKLTPFVSGTDYDNAAVDPKDRGITFANTTDVEDQSMHSQHVPDQIDGSFKVTKPDPPLMKVVRGNYSLWASNERWQCMWSDNSPIGDDIAHSGSSGGDSGKNSNDPAISGINAYSTSPDYNDGIGEKEYIVRIQACVSGLDNDSYCREYPDGNLKPIGLFQRWGDDDTLLFGMMTGTYQLHAVGGELASDIQSMKNEINVDTDGTFKLVVDTIGGPIQYNKASASLISRWSLFRIYGYDHTDGTYNTGDSCSWGLSDPADTTANGKCTNWGNPFSEIYLQSLRYMAGLGIDGTFRANDSGYIRGLETPLSWQNPLYECNSCARLNILNFNSSSSSYDYDNIDDNSNGPHTIFWDNTEGAGIQLPGDTSNHSILMTDVVGKGEGIHGNKYFIGETDITEATQTDDQLCTEKTITSLGTAGGICPEAPRLSGAFNVAGLAYYAHAYDIRPGTSDPQVDCGTNPGTTQGQRNLSGEQRVDTYGVSMATAVPTIVIPDPSGTKSVTLIPACRNTSLNPNGNCAIVDFKIVAQDLAAGTGQFYVNWEDSEQGGDYDQDMWGIISYVINSSTIQITTDVQAQSTPNRMGFGYVVSGTTDDGFHVHSGINGYNSTETVSAGSDCSSGCNTADAFSTATYSLGTSTAGVLKDPLWYAAKWGGFIDRDGNNLPFNDIDGDGVLDAGEETPDEWDSTINATGAEGSDGIPDNYFYATDPQALEDALNRVFLTILERTSSGTAAAVVANNLKGEGGLYQAYYEPMRKDDLGNEVAWIGSLTSMWVDSAGYLREDRSPCLDPDPYDTDPALRCSGGDNNDNLCFTNSDCSGKNFILDDYDTDFVIETYFDEIDNKTKARRWTSSDPDNFAPDTSTTINLEEMSTLWNAREELANLSSFSITSQRSLTDVASGGRHIFTWIDSDGSGGGPDGIVTSTEVKDFTTTAIGANYGFFDVADQATAENLINYTRGLEVSGYRERLLDYDGDGTAEVQRLGDIINSTPTVVGSPQEAFNLLYSDSSYASYLNKYLDRRNVIYVGGNDGMLHAFNGGYYLQSQASYSTYRPLPRKEWVNRTVPEYYTSSADPKYRTPHPLGSEMWAYVPKNLLPHLKWLTSSNYPHVYYVDGKPRIFDAKIFDEEFSCTPTDKTAESCVHPNGWGTVMVVGMRMGGGPMTIDVAADGLGGGNAADDTTMSSAYIIMDVTDSENPVLMGEVQLPDNSYSLALPTVLMVKDKVDQTINTWHLVLGNGPDDLHTVESSTTAKLFVLDLVQLAADGSVNILEYDTGVANSFVGPPTSVDWDLDYKSDGIYFGVTGWYTRRIGADTFKYTNGRLMRFGVDEAETASGWNGLQTVIDMQQPLTSKVSFGIDEDRAKWVYWGTGRFLSADDRDTSDPLNKTSVQTQSIYGLKVCYDSVECTTLSTQIDLTYTDGDNDNALDDRVAHTDIIDVTDVEVFADYSITNDPTATGISNLFGLEAEIEANRLGWVLDLPPINGLEGIAPATRTVAQPALFGGIVFTSVYQPSTDPCTGEGFSSLYGLYYKTGTAYPSIFGFDDTILNNGEEMALKTLDLGMGYATSPSIHSGSKTGDSGITIFTQTSTGTVYKTEAETKIKIRSGKQSWLPVN